MESELALDSLHNRQSFLGLLPFLDIFEHFLRCHLILEISRAGHLILKFFAWVL